MEDNEKVPENKALAPYAIKLAEAVKKSMPMVNNRHAKQMLMKALLEFIEEYKKLGGQL